MFPQSRLMLISLVPRPQLFDDITVLPWEEMFKVFEENVVCFASLGIGQIELKYGILILF